VCVCVCVYVGVVYVCVCMWVWCGCGCVVCACVCGCGEWALGYARCLPLKKRRMGKPRFVRRFKLYDRRVAV
jgi:hypothetical protein